MKSLAFTIALSAGVVVGILLSGIPSWQIAAWRVSVIVFGASVIVAVRRLLTK